MMWKVMIIDDEKALRNLLKKVIPWEELGLTVAGEAASGSEAIHTIDDIQPDLVLVDIRMPFMDGIEFSRLARHRYPNLKIVILTAYNEFEYAKSCIGIGVNDYLLKPIDRQEVTESLRQIVTQLPQPSQQQEAGTEVTESTVARIKKYLQEHYREAEMNLTSVAQEFGLNPSYLSRKFKQDTGFSFVDYLTGYRMDKAAKLALQGEIMYLAAEKVGIRDPNYFGKCFKKYKNVSYSEFAKKQSETERKSHGGEENAGQSESGKEGQGTGCTDDAGGAGGTAEI